MYHGRFRMFVCAVALVSLATSGCDVLGLGSSEVSIDPRLISVPTRADQSAPSLSFMPGEPEKGPPFWSSDMEIESLRIPLTQIILLSEEDNGNVLYSCTPTEAEQCYVELVGNALEDQLGAPPAKVETGEFPTFEIQFCHVDGPRHYYAQLTASVVLDGETYYTKAEGAPLTTEAPAEARGIYVDHCGETYTLPEPVVVADTLATMNLDLFYNIDGIALGALGISEYERAEWNGVNCTEPAPTQAEPTPYICLGYIDVAGRVNSEAPYIERYLVNGNSLFGLYFEGPDDAPAGGFTRFVVKHGVVGGDFSGTPIRELVENEDGTYTLSSGYFNTTSFRREDHSGTYVDEHGTEFAYTAVKLDP